MEQAAESMKTKFFENGTGIISPDQSIRLFNLIYNNSTKLMVIAKYCNIHPQRCKYVLTLLEDADIVSVNEYLDYNGEVERLYQIRDIEAAASVIPEDQSEILSYLSLFKETFDRLIANINNNDNIFTVKMTNCMLEEYEIKEINKELLKVHENMEKKEKNTNKSKNMILISTLGTV